MMIGKRLSDRYKIIDSIGGGGMANVYLARDIILERDVAVKVLRPDISNDEEFIRRFHREAQAATSLNHPNIVSIYDVGEDEQILYIVMEYIDGSTLKQYIQKNGPLSNEESVNIMLQLTSAINHAHENHIVHRDIKPQNILIDEHGVVKVTDFGIAVALSSTTITQTNSFLGSVHYLSPEQARGGMATKKSDIYSLGIVMFELITGRLPFFGESAVSIAIKHLQNETPSPKRWNPNIPQSIENIILKSTAKDSFYRYDNVEAMQEDLRTSLDPSRVNEQPFKIPELDGEETKAIPIIKDEKTSQKHNAEETIIHPDKGKVTPKKKKGKKIIITVVTSLILLMIGIVAAFTVFPSLFLPSDVTVPDVSGKSYEAAYSELDKLGFEIDEPKEVFDDEIEEGKVVKTNPKSGVIAKEGSSITIYTSKGKEKTEIEDYIGQNYEDISDSLGDKFKEVIIKSQSSSEVPAGEIIDQFPKTGEHVLEDTDLTLFVSTGPPTFELSNLVGYTIREVENYVAQWGLVLEKPKYINSEEAQKDIIIQQTPAPGTELKAGDSISIVVSKGPEEKPRTSTQDILVQYQPDEAGKPQTVRIYVEDMENELTGTPVVNKTITEDQVFQIQLIIPYEGSATYKVERDGNVIIERTVLYKDVQ
ncbi:Stk1 family PASTA domain-containing Ser/Thr kinase [Bacillus sp. BGMRC 2118]|nr:Stk1 family PASTA domain-containing Ser/Thr kinase [Bacillus sp. BGMRC 2118]